MNKKTYLIVSVILFVVFVIGLPVYLKYSEKETSPSCDFHELSFEIHHFNYKTSSYDAKPGESWREYIPQESLLLEL